MCNRLLVSAITLLVLPTSLLAADGVQVPEAPSGVLFALGVAGVLLGRYASRKRQGRDKPKD